MLQLYCADIVTALCSHCTGAGLALALYWCCSRRPSLKTLRSWRHSPDNQDGVHWRICNTKVEHDMVEYSLADNRIVAWSTKTYTTFEHDTLNFYTNTVVPHTSSFRAT